MEAMAQNKATTIEDLPNDALKQIVIRVAGPPNGAIDVARAFAVHNIFGTFIEDKEVLIAVSFKDCVPRCDGQGIIRNSDAVSTYERFQHPGGLLVKCAKARNAEAEFMLAKVVMVSFSRLFNTEKVNKLPKAEVPLWLERIFRSKSRDYNNIKLAETRTFIQHFSPVTDSEMSDLDHLVHFDLVSNFLSEAKVADLCEMIQFLKDYVTYNLVRGKEDAHKIFLATLDEMWMCESSRLAKASDPQLAAYFEQSRALCNMAYRVFRDYKIFEEQLRPLEESLLQINNRLTPEALLRSWNILIPMLQSAGPLTVHPGLEEQVAINNLYHLAVELWGFLCVYFANTEFLENIHLSLKAEFHEIFYSK